MQRLEQIRPFFWMQEAKGCFWGFLFAFYIGTVEQRKASNGAPKTRG